MDKHQRLLVFNDPRPMRINRELAIEIGYNESVVLLQLEHLVYTSTSEEHDGDIWTFQSLTGLKENHFPWWSVATISRIIKNLAEKELIKIGNYNKYKYDRTQWFALNDVGISRLNSIRIEKSILQNEKCKRAKRKMDHGKMKNASQQNETTIPESTTETTTKTTDKDSVNENATTILEKWAELFPDKPQPRAKTYKDKITARFKDKHFQEHWEQALIRAARSPTLHEESWFNFGFFVRNDINYVKCLDDWMEWKDKQREEKQEYRVMTGPDGEQVRMAI